MCHRADDPEEQGSPGAASFQPAVLHQRCKVTEYLFDRHNSAIIIRSYNVSGT